MPVYKRRNTSGKIVWFYKFQPPGASRHVLPIREFGFATKQAAVDAEVVRHTEEQQKYEKAKAGATGVAAPMPTTLSMLLAEFMSSTHRKIWRRKPWSDIARWSGTSHRNCSP